MLPGTGILYCHSQWYGAQQYIQHVFEPGTVVPGGSTGGGGVFSSVGKYCGVPDEATGGRDHSSDDTVPKNYDQRRWG